MLVPIVMASDENYLLPTCVTIISILENGSSKNTYFVYMLVNRQNVDMDKGIFEKLKQKYPNFEYQYLVINEELFANATMTNYHITVETYYRLVISDLLPYYERCLYLDGDLIVRCDVEELYTVDMKSDYLAAVKDIGMQCGQGIYYTRHQAELGFEIGRASCRERGSAVV